MESSDSRSLDLFGIKPVAESVNRLTKAAVDGASAFLSRLCLPAAEELGLLFRDKVAGWRARNAVAIVEGAREKLGRNAENVRAHPRIVGQIIDSGSWAEHDEIQDMWAGLLASSCSQEDTDDSNLIFVNLLSQLSVLQASIIRYSCENAVKKVSPGGWIYADRLKVDVTKLREITRVDDLHRIDRELDLMRGLELIDDGFDFSSQIAYITPKSLALQLYMRCKGHQGDVLDFYSLAPPVSSSETKTNKPNKRKKTAKKKTAELRQQGKLSTQKNDQK